VGEVCSTNCEVNLKEETPVGKGQLGRSIRSWEYSIENDIR
jgi:hypothetical protein